MRQETSTATTERNAVNRTSGIDRPSTPKAYLTLNPTASAEIQSNSSMNWKPEAERSKMMNITSAMINAPSEMPSAIHLG